MSTTTTTRLPMSSMRSDCSEPVANHQHHHLNNKGVSAASPSSSSSLSFRQQSRPVATATICEGVAPSSGTATIVVDRRLSISSVASSLASQTAPSSTTTTTKATATIITSSTTTTGRPPRFRNSFVKSLSSRSSSSNIRSSSSSSSKKKKKKNTMSNGVLSLGGPPENVMQWLEVICPNDLVPRVLAYCGPQMIATLLTINRYWFQLIANNDGTWRTICEGMYKWKEDQDDLPDCSWKEYYRLHPCVPIDYSTIPKALAVVTKKISNHNSMSSYIRTNNAAKKEQTRSVEILLRPGRHLIKESILVSASSDVTVTLKTMPLPKNRYYSPRLAFAEQEQARSYPPPKTKARSNPLRHWMGCKSTSSVVQSGSTRASSSNSSTATGSESDTNYYDSDSSDNSIMVLSNATAGSTTTTTSQQQHQHRGSLSIQDTRRIQMLATTTSSLMAPPRYPSRATIVLRTRRQNEPIIRVQQGAFALSKVNLQHASHGVDIWNGNAAVQVQPPMGADNVPEPVMPTPSAVLHNVAITSRSGRGVVCLDGGAVTLSDCMIHDCAATGLYIGGPGSQADVSLTDVIRNGVGSRLPASRAPRVTPGHSGVYVEQGLAEISECNISSNHLTGISVVSYDNAIVKLSKSDLVANGNGNLEMPPPGTVSYDKSDIAKDNNLASVGRPCLRSNLELPVRFRPRTSF